MDLSVRTPAAAAVTYFVDNADLVGISRLRRRQCDKLPAPAHRVPLASWR